MIKKQEINSIILIALPLMAAFLAQRGMQFIDTMMMGWIGPTALAAGALATSIFMTVIISCMGILSSIGVLIVRAKGAQTNDDIKFIMQNGLSLALLLSIPSMIVIWFTPDFLLLIGENPLVVTDAKLLLHSLVWGLPGFLLFLVFREFISAFSLTLIIMLVAFISIPLTFMANDILIYGKYFFPKLGIAGIGYGGAIVMWFMFFCLFYYSKTHRLLNKHIVFSSFNFKRDIFSDLLYIGLPSGGLFLLEAGMFLTTAILMGYFGIAALAAHQIAMQCTNIAYTFPVALSMATALRIGYAAGAKDMDRVKHIALISFSLVLLVSIILVFIFLYATNYLISIFQIKETNQLSMVYPFATSFIHISAFFLCFDALQSVANGALRGLRDTFIPMLLSIICYWVLGIGGAYYLSMHTALGAEGIWYGLTLGLASTAIILILRFLHKIYKEKI